MLEEMKPQAIDFGVASLDFYAMTMEDITDTMESGKRKRMAEMKEKAQFDYKLAQLNAFALNDPKKMPKLEEHYGFLKEFKNLEVEFLEDGRPVDNIKNVNDTADEEPEKPEWMIFKEIMMQNTLAINEKQKEEKRGE